MRFAQVSWMDCTGAIMRSRFFAKLQCPHSGISSSFFFYFRILREKVLNTITNSCALYFCKSDLSTIPMNTFEIFAKSQLIRPSR